MAEKLLMLALSPTMETGVISRWAVSEGDEIHSGDVLCEVETDKATMDYESPVDGVLLKIIKEAGSSASVGDPIGIVGKADEDISDLLEEAAAQEKAADGQAGSEDEGAKQPSTAPLSEISPADQPKTPDQEGFIRSSPLARVLAGQNNLDLRQIEGSGPGGRIVKADIEKAV
ncbi:MAG: hypothetical protein GX173_02295, partial [Ruminococcaceae bacterium]|nr:hypothetical protein [Oscillospiraceae bacterium]